MACGRVVGCDLQKSNRPLRYIGSFKDALNHLIAEAYEAYNRAEAGSLPVLVSWEERPVAQALLTLTKIGLVQREIDALQGHESPDMDSDEEAYHETYRQEAANRDEAFKEDLIVLFSFLRDLTEDDKSFIKKVDQCVILSRFFTKVQTALLRCQTEERSSRLRPWRVQCELIQRRIALRRELQYQEEQSASPLGNLSGSARAGCCSIM
jgi:hypothetical protein